MQKTYTHSRRRLVRDPRRARSPWNRSRGWLGVQGKARGLLYRVLAEQDAVAETSTRDERLPRLEAALLLAHEPLSTRKLAQLAKLADGTEARTMIGQLNERYDATGRAFRVEEVAGGYQLLTRPSFAPWLRRWAGAPAEIRLSTPAVETLAVVAYRQPVLRAEIEAVRGVQCGEMLRQLMERGFVRIAGRADELGRPFLYGTTRQFLQVFGLRNLDELPRTTMLREMMGEATGASQEQERIVDANGVDAIDKETAMTTTTFGLDHDPGLEADETVSAYPATAEATQMIAADVEDDDDDDEDEDDDVLEDGEWEEVGDDASDEDDDEDDDDWEDEDDDWEDDDETLDDKA